MALINKAFTVQRDQEERAKDKRETFTVSVNKDERTWLNEAKNKINEIKDSSAIKKLAYIGYLNVLHNPQTSYTIDMVLKNKRNNKRLGIPDFD